MKYQKILATTLIFSALLSEAFGQRSMTIVGDDGLKLLYATVANITKSKVYSADLDGIIRLEAAANDSIRFSYTGYRFSTLRFGDIKGASITLSRNATTLEAVVIADCSKKGRVKISNFNRRRLFSSDTIFYWAFTRDSRHAIKLTSPETNAVLKSFSFWMEKVHDTPDSTADAPFMISFLAVDTLTGTPGEPLRDKPLIWFPRKTGRQTLNLDSLHLHIPESGIFVAFQYITDDKYFWSLPARAYCHSCPDVVVSGYGGELKYVKNSEYPAANYGIFSNQWSLSKSDKALQFEAVLSFCKKE